MADFLLELRSEEIPARMQRQAATDLERLFVAELSDAGLTAASVETFVTPRRLALIARGLPAETSVVSEEMKGPRTSAPPQALEGFLRKTGLTQDGLTEREGVWFAVIDRPGQPAAVLLARAVKAVVLAMPWPKSMRWGVDSVHMDSLRWVRPLQGIVALLDAEVVPVEIAGVRSGNVTRGHRFMSSGDIVIEDVADYAAKLRAAFVIVSSEERAEIIAREARRLAADAGLALVEDTGLAVENAGLTEWPVPLLGSFDQAFLDVPPEVIQLTMRTNQKYFVCADTAGNLAPAFVATANIEATDGGAAIIAGNEKVLAARLSDARFFWEQDRREPLAEHANKLSGIVFHERLGTVADKVKRVARLARWLVEQRIVTPAKAGPQGTVQLGTGLRRDDEGETKRLVDLAEQAAHLCKADLVTGMVGEFPELQGIMGGHYARAEGLPDAVADAIRDHYKPVGQGDDVPAAPVTVAVSLADKLDTLVGFFLIDERPTGSKDPFALRRAMLGILRIVIENEMRFGITKPFQMAMVLQIQNIAWQIAVPFEEDFWALQSRKLAESLRPQLASAAIEAKDQKQKELIEAGMQNAKHLDQFLGDRLKVQQREAGVRHDLIDAVFALGGEDDLVRLLARVKALQRFIGAEDGANLLTGYKRAANILKAEAKKDVPAAPTVIPAALPYTPEPAEAALIAALDAAEPTADAAIAAEDFEAAMAALASLRAPIDAFFDSVTVNDADATKRVCRLALLERMRAAVHRVADFSKIEG